jgi:D-serine deaminase-like pyridoxal phosphate-dependent protein
MEINDLDTPALIVDLDALEKNIRTLANFFKGRESHHRPHAKGHKTPAIAHKQLEAGAKGICVAKLSEAELMASVGIRDILITNEIVTKEKIKRLAQLSTNCKVTVAVDDPNNIEDLGKVARDYQTELGVLVDVNVSQFGKLEGVLDRCGVLPGQPAVSLAKRVEGEKGLKFRGLMGYEGGLGSFPEFQRRKENLERALKPLVDTAKMIRETGLAVADVSAGSTGTWNITGAFPGITEVQAGSYALMDVNYKRIEGVECDLALSVLTTVISTPYPGKAITDIGQKGTCTASTGTGGGGLPQVKGIEGVEVLRLNVEHCHLSVKNPSKQISVGEKIELIPYEIDTTVNLYDKMYAVRRGRVEAEWMILGRGKSQ